MNLKRKARNLKKMMDVGGYDYYKQARKLQKELGIKEKTAFAVVKCIKNAPTEVRDAYMKDPDNYLYTSRVLNQLSEPTDAEKKAECADSISYRLGITKEEAGQLLDHLQEKWGFDYRTIMSNGYYKLTDEKIDQVTKLRYYKKDVEEPTDYFQKYPDIAWIAEKYKLTGAEIIDRKYHKMTPEEIKEHVRLKEASFLKRFYTHANTLNMGIIECDKFEKLRKLKFGETAGHFRRFKHWQRTEENELSFIACSDKEYFLRKYAGNEKREVHEDKEQFMEVFEDKLGRLCWSNKEGATFESFEKLFTSSPKLFVKPLRGRMGKGIYTIDTQENDARACYDEIMRGERVTVETLITQHEVMAQFGCGSVNTIRVVTVYDYGKCNFLYAVIRIGSDKLVDNFHKNGLIAEIDLKTGVIISNGYSLSCQEYAEDKFTGKTIKGTQIPYWDEVIALCTEAATRMKEVGVTGWDVAITENGPILVEGNPSCQLNLIEYIGLNKKEGRRKIIEHLIYFILDI